MYTLARILSLDVALGAISSASMVVWWYQVRMPWAWWGVLPLSVWLIYTLDHLLDATRLGAQAHTPRHRFHYEHKQVLWASWSMVLCLCACLSLWYLPIEMWYFGGIMCLIVLGHLGLVWLAGNRTNGLILKEFGVGLIYATGVWGGPLITAWSYLNTETWLTLSQFYAIALMNLLCFSILEAKIDEQDGHTSFVRVVGTKRATIVFLGMLMWVFLVMIINLTVLCSVRGMIIQLILGSMAGIIGWVYLNKQWFERAERYRMVADAVFWLPAIVWLIKG